jgi:hypothetical protein
MITVQKARELTENARQEQINARVVKAKELCETISKDIETECINGRNNLIVKNIDKQIYFFVIDEVRSVGYEVVKLDNSTIHIFW